jgi:hypothetical protein
VSAETTTPGPYAGLRGFGFTVTAGGWPRYWYIDPAGVKRWADNDEETK